MSHACMQTHALSQCCMHFLPLGGLAQGPTFKGPGAAVSKSTALLALHLALPATSVPPGRPLDRSLAAASAAKKSVPIPAKSFVTLCVTSSLLAGADAGLAAGFFFVFDFLPDSCLKATGATHTGGGRISGSRQCCLNSSSELSGRQAAQHPLPPMNRQ